MTINLSTIRSNIFADFYSVINSNVLDPLTRNKQWIFSTMPDIKASNFIGFPIIIIGNSNIAKAFPLLDNSYSDKEDRPSITIYTTSNKQLDELSDSTDAVIISSNFPQFTFGDYSESTGHLNFGAGNVYFKQMRHTIDIGGLE